MPNQITYDSNLEPPTDDKVSPAPTVGCPSAKYFVHPRVAYSVRGNKKQYDPNYQDLKNYNELLHTSSTKY